jgi:glycosyltransferase involved in cell wall biosynthesis
MFLPVSSAVAQANRLDEQHVSYQIIPNFIADDIEQITQVDSITEELPKGGYLLFVGRFERNKGAKVLLEAFSRLESSVPLVLIGSLDNEFKVLPHNVLSLGIRSKNAVMHAWKHATIALLPSICLDACPTTVMEAMIMGKPVIASSIGGLPDIIADNETGILVPPEDANALQRAIQYLLDNPAIRQKMGEKGRQRITRFQAKAVVPQIEQVYQEILQS